MTTKGMRWQNKIRPPCPVCGKPVRTSHTRKILKTCSTECAAESKKRHAVERHGLFMTSKGTFGGSQLSHRRRNKLKVLDHYSNGTMVCACCGEKNIEFLTIDHIDGGGHTHRKLLGKGKQAMVVDISILG